MTRSIVAIARGEVEISLGGRPQDTGEHVLVVGGAAGAMPPETFRKTSAGRMACSARQLVASTDGCHRKANTAARERKERTRSAHRRQAPQTPANAIYLSCSRGFALKLNLPE